MRRIITTLISTLTVFSVSFGQDFKKDIKDGLYLWAPGFVVQQISDTLRIFKLIESRGHYYKVANVLTPSKLWPIPRDSYPIPDSHKPTDMLIKAPKIIDIIELSTSRFSVTFPTEKGFNSANFIKRDFGYEMYLSNHDIRGRKLKESIIMDTTSYFKIYAFTLAGLENLKELKNFHEIDQTDFELLLTSMQDTYSKNQTILKNNMTFGIKIEGYKSYGIIESREIIIKSLLEMKYNPLIDPNDLDKARDRFKPKR